MDDRMSNNLERAGEARTHLTSVALSRPPDGEVDAGTDIVLKVKVSCPHGCDLRDRVVNVMAPDGAVVAWSRLAEFGANVNETTEVAFMAPDEVGEYSWTVVFPKQEAESGGRSQVRRRQASMMDQRVPQLFERDQAAVHGPLAEPEISRVRG